MERTTMSTFRPEDQDSDKLQTPNAETLQAMREVEEGKSIRARDVSELFEQLTSDEEQAADWNKSLGEY